MPRTPKPVAPPTTLTEAVLDLERRMTGGDALSEVLLPAEDWTRLVEMAEEQENDVRAEFIELLDFKNAVRGRLGMPPTASASQLYEELAVRLGRVAEEAASFDPLPPAKPKRQRKTKAVECEHCGDAHASDACGLKPAEEAEDPRQMSIEEDAA